MNAERQLNLQPAVILLIGDLLMLLLFTITGRSEHAMNFSWMATLWTTLPFILSYLVAVILLRLSPYREQAYASAGRAAVAALMTATVTTLLGLVLRTLMYEKQLFTAFFIVSLIAINVFLMVWRLVFFWLHRLFVRR